MISLRAPFICSTNRVARSRDPFISASSALLKETRTFISATSALLHETRTFISSAVATARFMRLFISLAARSAGRTAGIIRGVKVMLHHRAVGISVAGPVMGSRGPAHSCRRRLIHFMEELDWHRGRLIRAASGKTGVTARLLRATEGFLGLSGTLIS
jgi:hypothetical protein